MEFPIPRRRAGRPGAVAQSGLGIILFFYKVR